MNPQQQPRQNQLRSPKLSSTNNSASGISKLIVSQLIVPGIAVVAVLFVLQYLSNSLSNLGSASKLNLKKAELNPTAAISKKAQAEAPRYGLDDKTVSQEQVYIIRMREFEGAVKPLPQWRMFVQNMMP